MSLNTYIPSLIKSFKAVLLINILVVVGILSITPAILAEPTIWDGPSITFIKPDWADWNNEEYQDRITENVWLTRQDCEGLFNIKKEEYMSDWELSPLDTEWAWGEASDYQSLAFDPFIIWLDERPAFNILNGDAVLHLISDDIYLNIRFTSWTTGQDGDPMGGGFSYIRSTSMSDGLVAYYPFNGNANDESGNGNHGTVHGATLTEDRFGNANSAYRFGGYISVPDLPVLDFNSASPQTISMWLFRTGTASVMHFIGKRCGCMSGFGNYQLGFNHRDNEGLFSPGVDLPINSWTHVAHTFDGSIYKGYINADLIVSGNSSLGPPNDCELKIGNSGSCEPFVGIIDEVRIYNRALSESEIRKLDQGGSENRECNGKIPVTIFEDDFMDNGNNNWVEGNNDSYFLKIENGKYVFQNKRTDKSWFTATSLEIDQDDFSIESSIKKISGQDTKLYSMIWGLSSNNGDYNNYYFGVYGNGKYRYGRYINNKKIDVIEPTEASCINKYNATNKLAITKLGNTLQFFINDHYVDEAPFEPFFGNYLGWDIGAGLKVEIDNIIIKSLPYDGCTDNEYCKTEEGDCEGIGICTTRPQECPLENEPVCGCDGKPYSNVCNAARSGANVDYVGGCSQKCTYTISPESKSFDSSGGTGIIEVFTPINCEWTAVSNVSWIRITSEDSGTGYRKVYYSVSSNAGNSRTGTIKIGEKAVSIIQEAIPECNIPVDRIGVIETIPVGERPYKMALTPDGKQLYVVNRGPGETINNRGSISVINTLNNNVIATIPLDAGFPKGISITPDGNYAYHAISKANGNTVTTGNNRIEVIDTSTNTIITTIPIMGTSNYGPSMLAITPDGSEVYVTVRGSNRVNIINTAANEVVTSVNLGNNTEPVGIAITPDGKRTYVANRANATVSVINTETKKVNTTISLDITPNNSSAFIAITPDGRYAYVSVYQYDDKIAVVDIDPNSQTFNQQVAHISMPGYTLNEMGFINDCSSMAFFTSTSDEILIIDVDPSSDDFNKQIGAILCCKGSSVLSQTLPIAVAYVSNGEFNTVSVICEMNKCLENDDCLAEEYCKKEDGDCDGQGICSSRELICTAEYDSVCGCDGATYSSAYDAASFGVNVDYTGVCLKSLQIDGPLSVNENSYADYIATALFEDGTSEDVTDSVIWSVDSTYTFMDSSIKGRLRTEEVSSDEEVTLTASYTYNGTTKTASISVNIKADTECTIPITLGETVHGSCEWAKENGCSYDYDGLPAYYTFYEFSLLSDTNVRIDLDYITVSCSYPYYPGLSIYKYKDNGEWEQRMDPGFTGVEEDNKYFLYTLPAGNYKIYMDCGYFTCYDYNLSLKKAGSKHRGVTIDWENGVIYIIDPGLDTATGPFLSGMYTDLLDVVITPEEYTAIVSAFSDHKVVFIDIKDIDNPQIIGEVDFTDIPPETNESFHPEDLAITLDGRFVVASDGGSSEPPVYSVIRGVASIDVQSKKLAQYLILEDPKVAQNISVDQYGNVYVGDYERSKLYIININLSTGTLSDSGIEFDLNFKPINSYVSPLGDHLIVVGNGGLEVFKINGYRDITYTMFLSDLDTDNANDSIQSAVYNKYGTKIYLGDYSTSPDRVIVMDVQQDGTLSFASTIKNLLSDLTVGFYGVDVMSLEPDGHKLYIGNMAYKYGTPSNDLMVIDLSTHTLSTIELSSENIPTATAFFKTFETIPPDISVTPPDTLDFGDVIVGDSAELSFTVKNTGGGGLSGSATTSSPFSIVSGDTYNLVPGDIHEVRIRFNPTALGSFSKNVIFTGGGGATRTATGEGVPLPCTYTYEMWPSSGSFDYNGGDGYIDVTTKDGCGWESSSNRSWITITSGNTGNKSGRVNFSVSANSESSSRSGTITITDQTLIDRIFPITQEGQIVCTENSACSEEDYCHKNDEDCYGQGICSGRPTVCTMEINSVCGCDGLTYKNPCEAALNGVNVNYFGVCKGFTWNGNGSIISYSSDDETGFGLSYDMSRIHPSDERPVVFFQWEIDSSDGEKLQIYTDSQDPSVNHASITYGVWNTRSYDKSYTNVALPFTIDPTDDGFSVFNGAWHVVQVAFTNTVESEVNVSAKTVSSTTSSGTHNTSADPTASAILIDGYKWCGNGSIISYSSGNRRGYGLTQDMTRIHPSEEKPVVFFQWEIDSDDGRKLKVYTDSHSPAVNKATITYGPWHTREQDITYADVTLPFTIDPAKDGLSTSNGLWYVIQVAFGNTVLSLVNVRAEAVSISTDNIIDIKVTPENKNLTNIGQTEQLIVTGINEDGTTVDLTSRTTGTIYVSSDPTVASVGPSGLVTAVEKGPAIITVMNSGISKKMTVTVNLSTVQALPSAYPTEGFAPLVVRLEDGGYDPEGEIVYYEWDFDGDGTWEVTKAMDTSKIQQIRTPNPYSKSGIYFAVHRVTSSRVMPGTDQRAEAVAFVKITVLNNPLKAIASANPTNGSAPLTVSFSGKGTDENGGIILYEWDFYGDGTWDYSSDTTGDVTYTYTSPGTYQAVFRVTDNTGETATANPAATTIRVGPPGSPIARAKPDNISGKGPLTVNFTDDGSEDPDGYITRYEWDFDGDGTYDRSLSTPTQVTHTYDSGGTFTAYYRVTDNEGLVGIDVIIVEVNIDKPSLFIGINEPDNHTKDDHTLNPYKEESKGINTIINEAMPVTIIIKNNIGEIIRTLVNNTFRTAGCYVDYWDGRDDNNIIVPDGDYYAVLKYKVGDEIREVDLTYSTGGENDDIIFPPSHSWEGAPYEDKFINITFNLSVASAVTIFIGDLINSKKAIVLFDRKPFPAGSHTIYWDGLDRNGNIAKPFDNTLLCYLTRYNLPHNAIYVTGGKPIISNVEAEPNYFNPFSKKCLENIDLVRISYHLSEVADVAVKIVNLSTGKVVRIIHKMNVVPEEDNNMIIWDGRNNQGDYVEEGEYRLAIKASDANGNSSMVRYVLVDLTY